MQSNLVILFHLSLDPPRSLICSYSSIERQNTAESRRFRGIVQEKKYKENELKIGKTKKNEDIEEEEMIEAVKHGKERAESSLLNGLSGL